MAKKSILKAIRFKASLQYKYGSSVLWNYYANKMQTIYSKLYDLQNYKHTI